MSSHLQTTSVLHARNGDVRLAFEVAGTGPLLLMHGLGYGRWGWGPAARLLAERFTIVRFDNRGVGDSDVPPGPYSARQLADDAEAVAEAAGLGKAHVVGTSLGGMAAQELALAYPERVDRLVLACTTPGGASAHPLPEPTVRLFAEVPTLSPEAALRRMVENALTDEAVAARPELVQEIYDLRLANPPPLDGWQAQAAAGATFDAHTRLAGIRAPTLLLHGTADRVVDARNTELLAAAIPAARVNLFPGAGHLFYWEQPDRFARVVSEFLEDADGR